VRHQVQEPCGLGRGHRLDDVDLAVAVEVAEHLRTAACGQELEDRVTLGRFQVLDHLGDVSGVMIAKEVAKHRRLAGLEQLAEVGHQQRIRIRYPPKASNLVTTEP